MLKIIKYDIRIITKMKIHNTMIIFYMKTKVHEHINITQIKIYIKILIIEMYWLIIYKIIIENE